MGKDSAENFRGNTVLQTLKLDFCSPGVQINLYCFESPSSDYFAWQLYETNTNLVPAESSNNCLKTAEIALKSGKKDRGSVTGALDRRSIDDLIEVVHRNRNVKGILVKAQKEERRAAEKVSLVLEYLQKQNVAKNGNIDSTSDKVSRLRDKLLGPEGASLAIKPNF